MNKKIITLISGIILTSSLCSISVGAEVLNIQDNQLEINNENTNNNVSNENVIVREFIAPSSNEFAKAGDVCSLEYYSSTYIKCINKTTGRIFTCNPQTSYVGYGYANPAGAVGCLQGMFNYLHAGLSVDGIFGPKTYQKILEFQQMNSNILTPDGIAGPKTFAWAVESVFGVVNPITTE